MLNKISPAPITTHVPQYFQYSSLTCKMWFKIAFALIVEKTNFQTSTEHENTKLKRTCAELHFPTVVISTMNYVQAWVICKINLILKFSQFNFDNNERTMESHEITFLLFLADKLSISPVCFVIFCNQTGLSISLYWMHTFLYYSVLRKVWLLSTVHMFLSHLCINTLCIYHRCGKLYHIPSNMILSKYSLNANLQRSNR